MKEYGRKEFSILDAFGGEALKLTGTSIQVVYDCVLVHDVEKFVDNEGKAWEVPYLKVVHRLKEGYTVAHTTAAAEVLDGPATA
jgi:hypothetical protein